jgi:PAS domain S-box-containing protein
VFKGFFTAIETETVVRVQDAETDPAYPQLRETVLEPAGVQAFIAVPLIVLGELRGFMLFEHGHEAREWTLEDESLALTMGALAAPLLSKSPEGLLLGATANGQNKNATTIERAAARGSAVLWETDTIGCLTFVAGAVESVYGYGAEELRGKPVSFLADAQQAANDLERLTALLAGEPCVPYTCTHRQKNGTLIHVLVTAKAITGEDGSITGASGTAMFLQAVS